MRTTKIAWVAGLLALAVGQTLAFVEVWHFFVGTAQGQLLDSISFAGNAIGRDQVDSLVGTVLNAISLLSLAAATAVIVFIALIRRRIAVAVVAAGLIAGANVTAQLLKYGLDRPDLGVDAYEALTFNSSPSGHTAVAASIAVALVLVLPPTVRAFGGLAGAGYAALVGVATLSAGWHRPSDAVAALLVVGAWAAFAGAVLVLLQRDGPVVSVRDSHWLAAGVLLVTGLVLLAVAALALGLTEQVALVPPEELSRRRLFAAYAGGAAGIAGTACVVMGLVMAVVHRVVPATPPSSVLLLDQPDEAERG